MMYSKEIFSILTILLMYTIVTPNSVQAVWWNPKTWSEPQVQIKYIDRIVEKPVEVEKIIEVEKVVEKIVEKPVEKVITKTITNTTPQNNSDLIKQIESLTRERDNWKASFESMSREKTEIVKRNISLDEQNGILQNLIYDLNTKLNKSITESSKTQPLDFIGNPAEVQAIIDRLARESDVCVTSGGKCVKKIGTAASVYCANKNNRLPLTTTNQACVIMGY